MGVIRKIADRIELYDPRTGERFFHYDETDDEISADKPLNAESVTTEDADITPNVTGTVTVAAGSKVNLDADTAYTSDYWQACINVEGASNGIVRTELNDGNGAGQWKAEEVTGNGDTTMGFGIIKLANE